METLQHKVVWITGASSGIGEALSYAFAAKGSRLVLSARRRDELERVKRNCAGAEQIELLDMDLSAADELPEKVRWVIEKMGGIDILVNNAGISQRSPAIATSIAVYRKIMEVNFFGTVALSNGVLAHFTQRNQGLFVVIGSLAGKIGLPLRTAYCASKHALEGFYSSLKTETWKTNIRFLMVRPGPVKTNIAQNALLGDGKTFNQKDAFIEQGITPEKVAESVLSAIEKNKRNLVPGSVKERLVLLINKFLPKLVFNSAKKIRP